MTMQALPETQPTRRRKMWRAPASAALAATLTLALLVLVVRGAAAQEQPPLVPGAQAAGNLTSRFGDAWLLYACAGDLVTVTAASSSFSPYLEIYAANEESPLVEAGGDLTTTVLSGAPLTQTGIYTVAVLGERLSARGPYTLAVSLATTSTAAAIDTVALDVPDFYVAAGQSVTGTLASRFGDLWQMHLCSGAPVTISVRTTAFAPVLEFSAEVSGTLALITSTAESPDSGAARSSLLPRADAPEQDDSEQWTAAVFTPSRTIDLQVTVGGERRSDRGPYTLLVETVPVTATETITPAQTPLQPPATPPTAIPLATATPRPTATPSPAAIPTCRVLVSALRLRSGPGTIYEPPLAGLPLDTVLELLGRSADSGWVNVRVQGSALSGWVSAGAQYVQCNVSIGGLIVINAPPTPTSLPTSTPTNTPLPTNTPTIALLPTPTPPVFVVVPGTGSDGDVRGNLRTGPGVGRDEDGTMVFTRQIWFFADTQPPSGSRVDHVVFHITSIDNVDENGFPIEVHLQSEGTPRYCSFGGGEPDCNVLGLGAGARWPSTGTPIVNGDYNVDTRIFLDGDAEDNPSSSWFARIRIQSPDLPDASGQETAPAQPDEPTPTLPAPAPPESSEIQVELREVGPGSTDLVVNGAIAFQVAAWDPAVGTSNGDGIDAIYLAMQDSTGTVHSREERVAAYCAFAGGEPDCNVYDYAAAGYVWDTGAAVELGPLVLTADVYATDGRVVSYRWDVEVQ